MDTQSPRNIFNLPGKTAERMQHALAGVDPSGEYTQDATERLETLWQGMENSNLPLGWLETPHTVEALARLAYSAPFIIRHLSTNRKSLAEGLLSKLDDPRSLPDWEGYAPNGTTPKGTTPKGTTPGDTAPGSTTKDTAKDTTWPEDPELMRGLRLWKYDSYAWFTARELLGLQSTAETCRMISDLADGMIRIAYAQAFYQLTQKHGLPFTREGCMAQGGVVGMGKLGGGELNYASDVDIIFFHDGDDSLCRLLPEARKPKLPPDPSLLGPHAESPAFWEAHYWAQNKEVGEEGEISSGEFYNRLGRQVIRMVSTPTQEGIGFRVDADLRPQGKSGLLAPSLGFMEDYYLRQGREWERTAMIKARLVVGSAGLDARFHQIMRPFVYRRYLDYSALEGVAIVKHDINRVHRNTLEDHIKLGWGGIREVEFLVQALQLLYGGKNPDIQVTGHQEATLKLVEAGVLGQDDADEMLRDYWHLRGVENRIQMFNEAQTHLLPSEPAEQMRVLHDFQPGFQGRLPQAQAALHQVRQRISQRFQELFSGMGDVDFPEPDLWRNALNEHLHEEERGRFEKRIDSLFSGIMTTRIGERCVFKLTNLLANPLLYRVGTQAAFPRWVEFFEQTGNRNAIYTLIEAHPPIVSWVSHIFSEGGRHARVLIRHPEFLETFFSIPEEWDDCQERFAEVLKKAGDEEEFLLELQTARAQNLMRILTHYLNHEQETRHRIMLSELADAVVGACTRFAWRKVAARMGLPENADLDEVSGFAVLAMGKLGSRELRFGSDLDLVFVYGDEGTTDKGRSHYEFYTRLAQTIGNLLTSRTMFGQLHELDHRLRPFGSKGLLVPSLATYRSYLAPDAQGGAETWNFQAFTRMRAISGDLSLANALLENIGSAWQKRGLDRAQVTQAVEQMLGRLVVENTREIEASGQPIPLKFASGGLIGFEFLRQAHFLCEKLQGSPHWTPPPPHEKIEALAAKYEEIARMDERLSFYVEPYDHVALPEHFKILGAIASHWNHQSTETLCNQMAKEVESLFQDLKR